MKKHLISLLLIFPLLPSCNLKDKFSVEFRNDDGSVLLKQENVLKGTIPTYIGVTPSKNKIKGTSYIFNSWDKELAPIYKDEIYTATYKSINNYEITWKNYDGSILKIDEMVDEGSLPTYNGKVAKKKNDGDTYYYFSSWDKDISKAYENKEYTATFKETTKYSDIDNDGLFDYDDPKPLSNTYNVKMDFNCPGYTGYSINTSFDLDYTLLDKTDNTTYNKEIARLSAILDVEATLYGTIYFNDELNNKSSGTDFKNIYKRLGCDDIRIIDLNSDDYDIDKNDIMSVIIGHHKSYKNNKDYIFITVLMGGTLLDRWVSNLDIGCDTPDYYKKNDGSDVISGDKHIDWVNKDYHKGFYVTSNRLYFDINNGIKKNIIDMIEKYTISDLTILTSGYSRAGSIANIIGGFIEDDTDIIAKKFCYTCGSMSTHFLKDKDNYKTIFNIYNTDDLVPRLSKDLLESKINGIRKTYSGRKMKDYFLNKTKNNYICITNLDECISKTKSIENFSRDNLYKVSYNKPLYNEDYLTLNGASQDYKAFNSLINNLKIEKEGCDNYFNFLLDNKNLKCFYCPAGIAKIVASVFGEIGKIDSKLTMLSLFNKFDYIIDLVLTDYLSYKKDLIGCPHSIISYYLMIENNKFNE